MIELGALYTRIDADTKGLKSAEISMKNFAGKAVNIMAGVTAAVSASIVAGGALIKTAAAEAKELKNLANVAGVSAGELDSLSFATNTVGINAEKLADISKDVQEKIGDFIATGAGEFADFFENVAPKIGVTAQQLAKLSGPDALQAIKNGLDAANVSSKEQIFYMESIASDASYLIPLLAENGKQFKIYADRAKELNRELSAIDRKKLEDAARAGSEFTLSLKGIERQLSAKLSPSYTKVIDNITKKIEGISEKDIEKFSDIIGKTIDKVVGFADAILKLNDYLGLPNLKELGVLAGILYKFGPSAAGAAGAVVLLNEQLERAGLGSVQKAKESWEGYTGAIKNLYDVAQGRRDFNTGEIISEVDQIKNKISELESLKGKLETGKGKAWFEFELFTDPTANRKRIEEIKNQINSLNESLPKGPEPLTYEGYLEPLKSGIDAALRDIENSFAQSTANNVNTEKKSLKQIEEEYKKSADKIKEINKSIVENQQSGEELLRGLKRSGMSGVDAWKDIKKQALEYEDVAEKAAQSGDFEKALDFADKAQSLFQQLNQEVEKGGKVVISGQKGLAEAIKGVERIVELRDMALKAQKQNEIETANALSAQAKEHGKTLETFEAIDKKAKEMNATTFVDLGTSFTNIWTEGGTAAGTALDGIITKVDDAKKKIEDLFSGMDGVQVVVSQGRKNGGLIQKLREGGTVLKAQAGRYFPGFGGGDKIPIMGEAGEYMINKFSVRSAGVDTARAFNNGDWKTVISNLSKKMSLGGPTSPTFSMPSLALANGGSVSMDQMQGNETTRNYYIQGSQTPISVRADEKNAKAMLAALRRVYVGKR